MICWATSKWQILSWKQNKQKASICILEFDRCLTIAQLINNLLSYSGCLRAKGEEMVRFNTAEDRNFLLLFLVLMFSIHSSNSQCTSRACEKKFLSLKTDMKVNSSLHGSVFETLNFSIRKECFHTCLSKCQCLSFNFNEINKTENCELNDANTKLAPEALKEKEGVIYYEPVRTYYDKNVSVILTNCRV